MKLRNLVLAAATACSMNVAAGTLYTINEESSDHGDLYILDASDGSATLAHTISNAGDLGASLLGGAYDSSRDVLFFTTYFFTDSNSGLASVDYMTGEGTWVGEIGGPADTSNTFGAAYDSTNDVLYASDDDQSPAGLLTIDRDTGEGTAVGPFDDEHVRITGMAYDADSDTLYGVSEEMLYTINRGTGEATEVGSHGLSGVTQMGLAVDPDNGIMYLLNDNSLYTMNKQSGAVSLVGDTGLTSTGSLAVIPSTPAPAIPTMGSMAMWIMVLLLGITAVLTGGQRMRSRS